jgi:hypothetical protein
MSYIVYDKVTGLPIGRHRQFDAVANKLVEVDEDEVLALYGSDEAAMQQVTDSDAANLAVIRTSLPLANAGRRMRVTRNRLVEQPHLVMVSDHDELEGDGEQSATLTIMLRDSKGKTLTRATDAVRVTTTRGKLSARGGLVELERGRATLSLRAAPETVQAVTVRCELVNGGAEPAEIRLSFV